MDSNQDFIRREAKAIEAEHREDLARDRDALDRLVSGDGTEPSMLAAFNRRVMMFGGFAVVTAAVVAACKGATPPLSPNPATTTTTAIHGNPTDISILQTISSLEALAVAVYTSVINTDLVATSTTLDLIKLFQSQHSQHLDLIQRSTRTAGATAYSAANPLLMQQVIQPRLAALTSEAGAVSLSYDLEHMLSATDQASIGIFSSPAFNTATASVGATEARHVALLALISGKSATGTPDNAFQIDTDAVKPGTGI
jgi:hypothetical protein